jgi:F0F1-type ATP synthase assembly protein I
MSEIEKLLEKRRARNEKGREYRAMMHWAGRAMEVPLSIVVGVALGVVLDRNFGIAPYGIGFGIFIGIATAVRFAYRLNRDYQKAP